MAAAGKASSVVLELQFCMKNKLLSKSALPGIVSCIKRVPQPLRAAVFLDRWSITTVSFEMDSYEKICSRELLWKNWIRCRRIFEGIAVNAQRFSQSCSPRENHRKVILYMEMLAQEKHVL